MSEQPTDHGETVAGAEARARNVLATGGYNLGVGIECGVADVEAAPELFLTTGSHVNRSQGWRSPPRDRGGSL